ncbi:hypothetical protein AVEN_260908-1 [Araneus ventricosus]|uniref:Uncharacterized protein n=1 Tax=Araneus ventricosus TaxID=182803 RepID=A0A4Y2T9Q5_ARAVE|nr:hypothetical protein AVEN_260908-1 [Araneus ventricosus]
MLVELEPPPWYQPLPSVVSETTDRFRWPVLQTRQICSPPPDRLSVEGPLDSPPPKPRLRYHRQSTYTDVFDKHPLSSVTTPKIESLWRYPVGKHGDFSGESTYERVHRWPSKVERQEECKPPPLISTMGLGIIPILGRGDGPQVAEKPSGEKDREVDRKESVENYLASQR